MKRLDLALLLALAALWGSSYLFIQWGAGEFGAVPLAGLRAAGATAALLPLIVLRRELGELRAKWRAIALVGIAHNAIPYVLFSYAASCITAGLSSILTSVTPLFTALMAWGWFGEALTRRRLAGLAAGFGGVLWLAWDKAGVKPAAPSSVGLAVVACLAAAALYGFSANFTKRYLGQVSPLVVTAGSQLVSALVLAVPAALLWPATMPSARAWGALAALSLGCTAVAYVLFFRLIARVGASRTVTVTFLIPIFGLFWGALFLGETVTNAMIVGGGLVLAGTALTSGVGRLRARAGAALAAASPAAPAGPAAVQVSRR